MAVFAFLRSSELDLDIHAGGEIKLHQCVNRLRRGLDDVEQPLVGAHLELFALFLSICGDRLTVNFSSRVGSGTGPRTRAPVRFAVLTISRVEASRTRWSNALSRMRIFWPFMMPVPKAAGAPARERATRVPHSMMEATTPAPTVRPPSRMAKRSRSSMAIGTISSTSIATLSPGITISVPSGRCTTPVTSVVRK
jgi:hypothetical protein